MSLFSGSGWERGMCPWGMAPFGASSCREGSSASPGDHQPLAPTAGARPQWVLQDSLSPKGACPGVMNIFNFQKMERPHSLSNLAGDNLRFQINIQALQKPPSCWPPGHLRAARDVTLVDTIQAPSSRCYWLPLPSPPFSLERSSLAAGTNPCKRGHSPHQPRASNHLPARGESPSPAAPHCCKLPWQCSTGKKRCYQPKESPHPALLAFYLLLGSATALPHSKARLSLNPLSPRRSRPRAAVQRAVLSRHTLPSQTDWLSGKVPAVQRVPRNPAHSSSLQRGPRSDKDLCKAPRGKRMFWLGNFDGKQGKSKPGESLAPAELH